jgi:hypothetical protein
MSAEKSLWNSVLGLAVSLLLVSACARSLGYKRDQDTFEDNGNGYYSDAQPKGSASDRLERMKQPKKKVLVMNFWNDTPVGDQKLGEFAAEEMRRELLLSKRVLLPEEKNVTAVTKDFVEGDRVQSTQLVREGRRVGVTTVIVGRISKIIFRQDREEVGILREAQSAVAVDVEMKLFDVATGREVYSAKRGGSATNTTRVMFDADASTNKEARAEIAKSAIHEAIVKLMPDTMIAMDKMDWQGRIAKILGNKVYINSGKASGILAGDILRVMSPGEEIVDPVTKSYLGRSEGLLKGTLEVSEFIGEDSSMTMIHTGGNFQEGDVVRLY